MPQVLGVVGQLLLVLALTHEDFLHVTGQGLAHLRGDLLVAAGHAPLVEGRVATLRAPLGLVVLVLADRLVQLLAVVEFVEAVEVDFVEVLEEPDDVAAEVQQDAVGLSGVGRRAQATAPHLDRGAQALAQGACIAHTAHIRHVEALCQGLHADQHLEHALGSLVLLEEHLALLFRGLAREHRSHHAGVDELPAQFLAVLDGRAEHDGLAVVAELVPVIDHVAHDLHAALFGRTLSPLTTRGLGTGHVGLVAGEDSHGHQHAVLREFVHGGGIYQVGKDFSHASREGCGRQADHRGARGLRELSPCLVGGVGLVHHQHVHLGPVGTLGDGLHRGDLEQFVRALAPVVGLNDPVLVHAVAIRDLGGLIDQRGAITQEDGTLALLDGLVAHPQTKVGLPGPGGGHDDLVFVALFESPAQGVVGLQLKVSGSGESIIALTRR